MDDFELGMSSGTSFFRDDFYESFQAPKFYDFINPRDSRNADEWFLAGFAPKSVKDLVSNTVQAILQVDSDNASPRKPSLIKDTDSTVARLSKDEFSENNDPNQCEAVKSVLKAEATTNNILKQETPKKLAKRSQKLGELSPVPQLYRYEAPATVPQKKKILGTRKAAEQQHFSKAKALLEKFRDAAEDAKRLEGAQNKATVAAATKPDKPEFQKSQRKESGRDSDAAKYVLEQAVMLESAIKLLRLDDEKNEKVCTEVLAAVCAERKPEDGDTDKSRTNTNNVSAEPVFSFKATRKENTENTGRRKRKSLEMTSRRKIVRKSTVPPVACPSPPPSIRAAQKRPRVTCPQPFRLRTEERGALKEIEFNKKMEQYIALREGSSSVTSTASTLPKVFPVKRKLQRGQRQQPTSKDNRSPVEVSIEMITKDLRAASQTKPEESCREARKQTRMPSFNRPFKPQRSTKKLTIPIEPKFHTIHARRTCSRHCHTSANAQ